MSTTKWLGLWHQERKAYYSGQVIKKADIPNYTRIVMRFNKFYNGGDNQPRFVYCFADSKGYESKCVPIEYEEESLFDKVQRLAEVLRKGKQNANSITLPSESEATAAALMDEAIELIEDITGEEWDFSYWTFDL